MALAPRAVVVSRPSELTELTVRHGTLAAAQFFLRGRGQDLALLRERHENLSSALAAIAHAIPADWRRGAVNRDDLSRFLFSPQDVVIVVGQDGLVANVAKYLRNGQPVVGVNPDHTYNPGVLVQNEPDAVRDLLADAVRGAGQSRTLVAATLDDGQRLIGLNEIYLGHPSHQSARYVVRCEDRQERQSSSGLVVGTGTGATGWAASIAADRQHAVRFPQPDELALWWFVREAWASPTTGNTVTNGVLSGGHVLRIVSESDELTIFADGIEADHLTAGWGQRVEVSVADERLRLL
ncbi:MAG: hypothetical protein HOQ05_04245 [Corynebacteriales bacterium]|nr:hypothetical protein [Mycobacteriales bacterium]